MKLLPLLAIAFLGLTAVNAEPVVDTKGFHDKLAKVAGEKGIFAPHENFPKDYFLVPKNLPFLVGLSLHHPKSSELNLSKEQIEKIKAVKKVTVPTVLKSAKAIKALEWELANNIVVKKMSAESQYNLVEKIANLRTELTKKHLTCIERVRAILTDEQFAILSDYASKAAK
ncbi:MAG: hypothetical protein CSA45_04680 [Gammaproteobacteria bacterium]|nr:MAG: hypothetical protein CSA45_04680 [Gammaproteobacteria bacterium]